MHFVNPTPHLNPNLNLCSDVCVIWNTSIWPGVHAHMQRCLHRFPSFHHRGQWYASTVTAGVNIALLQQLFIEQSGGGAALVLLHFTPVWHMQGGGQRQWAGWRQALQSTASHCSCVADCSNSLIITIKEWQLSANRRSCQILKSC